PPSPPGCLARFRPPPHGDPQSTATTSGLQPAIPLPRLDECLPATKWDTRAWTYQEKQLSRRCIVFTPWQVHYYCQRDRWCEDLDAELEESRQATYANYGWRSQNKLGPKYPFSSWPNYNLNGHRELVQEYTSRDM